MKNPCVVTSDNLELCKLAKVELIERKEELAALTRRYPLECIFGEIRRVFANREDIEHLIDELSDGIARLEWAV